MNIVLKGLKRLLNVVGLELIPTWRLERLDAATHLKRIFATYGVDCVLDVGANEGQFHDFLRREVEFKGWIVSFEPAPIPLQRLTSNSQSDRRWKIVPVALGSQIGHATLNVAAHSTVSSLRVPRFDMTHHIFEKRQISKQIDIPVSTLDCELPILRRDLSVERFYLKMDTQGYDLEVVKGGKAVLPQIVALQSEMSVIPIYEGTPTHTDALAFLQEYGFRPSNFFRVSNEWDSRLIEFDCIMVHPDRIHAHKT